MWNLFVHSSIPVSKLSLCVCIVTILTLAVISAWLSLSPLSPDPTLTVASVTAVLLESVGDWYVFGLRLDVPGPVLDVIRYSHRGDRECKTALAKYFVSSMPGASWTTLAGTLYRREESAALLAVGRHLKEEKGWWGNVICCLCTFRVCGSQRLLVLSLVVCVVAYCALVNCVSPSVSVNCTAIN